MRRAKGLLQLIVLGSACILARPASAQQVVVRVTGEDGTPIANAGVEFWQKTRKILALQTRPDGLALADLKKVRGLTSVSARAIGFRAASIPASSKDTILVQLSPVAPRLPDIVVEPAPRYECHQEDATARAAWRTASSRLNLLPQDRGFSASGLGTRETITLSNPSTPESWGQARWTVSGSARMQAVRLITDSGYAVRRKRGNLTGVAGANDFAEWWYPRLHSWNADHFARPEFGRFNTLWVVSSGPTGWTIGFCSHRAKRPNIAGLMRIDSAYRFVRAEWEFQTPKPKEDAGGEIVFLAGTNPVLVPLVSYFWRRLDAVKADEPVYFREAFQGEEWTINLDDPLASTRTDSASQ